MAQKQNYLSKYKKSSLTQVKTKIFTSHRFYLRHSTRQNLEMGVLEDQVVDHIISRAEIEDVVADYDSVISGAAIAPPEVQDEVGAEGESKSD